jgi:hypothetical protein
MSKRLAIAVLLAWGAGTAAFAETPEQQQACTNDAFQFCQNVFPDREKVFACLAQHRHVISALCQTAMAPYLPTEQVAKKQVAHAKTTKKKGPLVLAPQ